MFCFVLFRTQCKDTVVRHMTSFRVTLIKRLMSPVGQLTLCNVKRVICNDEDISNYHDNHICRAF